uniref:Ubiquitin carboxyl-terminal hydrolase n=1 Tax=Rhizophora mucronata TaxID=61149 RepID=A0A2P2P525_RHIMU
MALFIKQVFPRFCNPVNPKQPASPDLPRNVEELRKILLFMLLALPFISTAPHELVPIECCAVPSSFFPSLHFMLSDNP